MELYQDLFNTQTLANIAIVSSLVTAIRNVVKLRGAAAVVLTFLVSITYGVLQFGLSSEYGIVYGAIVGMATALSFYLTKNVGAIVAGDKLRETLHQSTQSLFVDQRRDYAVENGLRKLTVWNVLKFILFRKL